MTVARVIAITIVWLLTALPLEAATVTWDPNPEPDVVGYVVSYGTQSGVHTTQVNVGKVLTFSLTPPAGQSYYVVVQAYNAAGSSPKSAELVLSSATANQPPTLNQPANQSGYVGSSATLALSASDPERATLTYSASGLPPGLTVNSSSGVISGTLQTAGNYNVIATASDGSLTASRTFMWVVSTQTSSTPTPTPAPIPAPTPPADTTAPRVSFDSPSNNDTLTAKNVKVRITASDAGGIRLVRYWLNGSTLSGDLLSAPYNYTWDTSKLANGSYQLEARAVDNAGNVGTATVSVTVRSGGNGRNSLSAEGLVEADGLSDGSADATAPVSRATPDIAVNGDFDGDGLDDPGAFTPSIGEWRLWLSSNRYAPAAPMVWGSEDDVPVPADYDGDGRTDLAVFRPSTGTWSIVLSNHGTPSRLDVTWGRQDDRPIAFDYDHDGRADLALARSGGFDILLSTKNYGVSVTVR